MLLKEEITKVYEKIKNRELKWKSFFGEEDCSTCKIYFSIEYRENIGNWLGGIELIYSDDMWKNSYEDAMKKEIIQNDEFKKFSDKYKK